MAARSTNTFAEFLERLMTDLGQAKLLSDADLPWLLDMEANIVQKYREGSGIPGMEQAGQVPAGQGPMPPGMSMPAMAGAGGPSFLGEGGSRMPMMGAGAPNADELRRLLSAGG